MVGLMINIEKLRLLLQDLSMPSLAKETGIHQNSLYKIRRGKSEPRVQTLAKIETYLKSRGVRFDG